MPPLKMNEPDRAPTIAPPFRQNPLLRALGVMTVALLVLLNRPSAAFNHQSITSVLAAMPSSLQPDERTAVCRWLMLDTGFAIVYGSFLLLLCRKSATMADEPFQRWQKTMSWLVIGSAVLDLVENGAQWASVNGTMGLHPLLSILGCLKWAGPVGAMGYWFLTRPKRAIITRIVLGLICVAAVIVFTARFVYGHVDRFAGTAGPIEPSLRRELTSNLEFTVRHLSQDLGPANAYGTNASNLKAKEDWIAGKLQSIGYFPSRMLVAIDSNKYSFGSPIQTNVFNLVAEREGTNKEAGIIIIGAHYDTMAYSRNWTGEDKDQFAPEHPGTPGANDNASGVAAMLEIARALPKVGLKRTVRFVAFANEEPPFFQTHDAMGSWQYAQVCSNRHERVFMMISLDALAVYNPTNRHSSKRSGLKGMAATFWGLPDEPNYVAFVSNWNCGSGLKALEWAKTFSKHSQMAVRTMSLPFISGEYFAWSDDWSFTQQGFPAFTVTDTAFYRSSRYHELGDTFKNLTHADFEGFTDVVYGLSQMLREMANQ